MSITTAKPRARPADGNPGQARLECPGCGVDVVQDLIQQRDEQLEQLQADQAEVEALTPRLLELWHQHVGGELDEPLNRSEAGFLGRWREGELQLAGRSLDLARQMLELRGMLPAAQDKPAESPAEPPSLEQAAYLHAGVGKTVVATRADCGADLYLWSIRTDDGRWMSEFGCSVPAALRKSGLASKEASIAPVTAGKFGSRPEAEVEALERGLDWLEGARGHCSGEAQTLVDVLLPLVERSIRELAKPSRQISAAGAEPAPVAAATKPPAAKSKRPSLAKAAALESPAVTGTLVGAQVVEIPVDKVHRRPSNRGGVAVAFPDVADLMESIEALGLSQPIQVRDTSEEQELPVGHVELVKGERRWTAFRALGRETIPAIVLQLDARAASIQAGIDNTHGRPLDPIQRLREIQHAVQHDGCTLKEAALSRGIKPKQAEGDLRVLQLPADLQQAIASGDLAMSVARAMLPYREIPAAVKRFTVAVKKRDYRLQRSQDGDKTLRQYVLDLVREVTRPLDAKTQYYGGYQTGTVACEAGLANHLTPELKTKLQAVEVRIDNKPTLLAQNVKAWDEANAAAAEERNQKEKETAHKKAAKAGGKAGTKAANPQAEVQQDRSLESKVKEWGHRFLRQAIAKHLVAGDYRTAKVARWVAWQVRDGRYGNVLNLDDWLVSLGELWGVVKSSGLYGTDVDSWDLIQRLIPDTDNPSSDAQKVTCELTRLLLWPVAGDFQEDSVAKQTLATGIPSSVPELPYEGVEAIAAYLAGPTVGPLYTPWPTKLQDAWARGRQLRSDEALMIADLIGYPNRRQLAGWVKEWGVTVDLSRKLDDARHELEQLHTSTGLKLLKCLEGGKAKKGRRR